MEIHRNVLKPGINEYFRTSGVLLFVLIVFRVGGGLVVSQVRSVVNMSRFHICLQIHETLATPCRDRCLLTG